MEDCKIPTPDDQNFPADIGETDIDIGISPGEQWEEDHVPELGDYTLWNVQDDFLGLVEPSVPKDTGPRELETKTDPEGPDETLEAVAVSTSGIEESHPDIRTQQFNSGDDDSTSNESRASEPQQTTRFTAMCSRCLDTYEEWGRGLPKESTEVLHRHHHEFPVSGGECQTENCGNSRHELRSEFVELLELIEFVIRPGEPELGE